MKRLRMNDTVIGYALAAPLLLWLAVVMGYPLVSTIRLSFFDQRIIGTEAPFVGLKLYRKLTFHPEVVEALISVLETRGEYHEPESDDAVEEEDDGEPRSDGARTNIENEPKGEELEEES